MKISAKRTALAERILSDNITYSVDVNDEIEFISKAKKEVDTFLKNFTLNPNLSKYIISTSFENAYVAAHDKMIEIMKKQEEGSRVPFHTIVIMGKTTFFYSITPDNKEYKHIFQFVRFEEDFIFSCALDKNSAMFLSGVIEASTAHVLSEEFFGMLSFELFLKYCPIETVYLEPKSRIKRDRVKYINESSHGFTILDSTYFTNIYRNEGFKVSGHFRLQPYKNSDKKLIWISDYEKMGYNKKATV